jgi:uncharacterized protein YndB with AHSA1/START domain
MENTMQDVIEREFVTKASKDRVFNAITDPEQIVSWFPDAIEGDLKKGERVVFEFKGHGKSQVYIVAVDPTDYFAYRWVPGSNTDPAGVGKDILDRPNTLVDFRLEEIPEGTKVSLRESGFASLPAETMEKALGENTQGWGFMLGRLEKLLS